MYFGVVSQTGWSICVTNAVGSHGLLLRTTHGGKSGILEKQLPTLTGNGQQQQNCNKDWSWIETSCQNRAYRKWWERDRLGPKGRMKQRLKLQLHSCWGNSGTATAACCISRQQPVWRRRAERSLRREKVLKVETEASIWLWVTACAKSWS